MFVFNSISSSHLEKIFLIHLPDACFQPADCWLDSRHYQSKQSPHMSDIQPLQPPLLFPFIISLTLSPSLPLPPPSSLHPPWVSTCLSQTNCIINVRKATCRGSSLRASMCACVCASACVRQSIQEIRHSTATGSEDEAAWGETWWWGGGVDEGNEAPPEGLWHITRLPIQQH